MGGGKSNLKRSFMQEFLFTASPNVKCSVFRVRGRSLTVSTSLPSFLNTNKSWLSVGGLPKGEKDNHLSSASLVSCLLICSLKKVRCPVLPYLLMAEVDPNI